MGNAQGSQLTPGGVGLYRARNRTYSPTLGRWLQRDPFGSGRPILEQDVIIPCVPCGEDDGSGSGGSEFAFDIDVQFTDGSNLFLFVGGNPIARVDPLGLFLIGTLVNPGTMGARVQIDTSTMVAGGAGWQLAFEVLASATLLAEAVSWLIDTIPFAPDDAGRQWWVCSIKPRNVCPSHCQSVFRGEGPDSSTAETIARQSCYSAGCHRPQGYNCNCGHVTCWREQ